MIHFNYMTRGCG